MRLSGKPDNDWSNSIAHDTLSLCQTLNESPRFQLGRIAPRHTVLQRNNTIQALSKVCSQSAKGPHKTLMPDIRSIQKTSQRAITATKTYLIHCPTVFGSVRFGITTRFLEPNQPGGAAAARFRCWFFA